MLPLTKGEELEMLGFCLQNIITVKNVNFFLNGFFEWEIVGNFEFEGLKIDTPNAEL
jgi:hypothetical protein